MAKKTKIVEEGSKDVQSVQLSFDSIENNQIENEEQKTIEQSEKAVVKQKSKKKKLISFLFILVNIAVVIYIIVSQLNSNTSVSIQTLLSDNFNWWFLFMAVVLFGLYQIFEAMPIHILIKNSTKKNRPFLSMKTNILGRYYDSVTPMASGGQPFQIFYLKSHGLDASSSISIPMGKFVINQIAWLIVTLFFTIYAIKINIFSSSSLVGVIAIVSYLINVIFIGFILFLSVSKSVGKKIVVWVLKLLQKIHIIKNYEKIYNNTLKIVNDYQVIMTECVKNGKQFFSIFLCAILKLLFYYSIPFAIYCSFNGFDISLWFTITITGFMVDVASSLVPLPGGTGVSELSFTAIFLPVFGGKVVWAMLIWRFFNYYIFIFQGLILILYDYLVGNRKYRWQKKRWILQEESKAFQTKQLINYKNKKADAMSRKYIL